MADDVLTREEVERIRGYWKDWKFGTPHAVSGCDCDECRERNEVLGLAASHAALCELLAEARKMVERAYKAGLWQGVQCGFDGQEPTDEEEARWAARFADRLEAVDAPEGESEWVG